ncbi:MAG TPA: Uma2 family endonuclease [Lacipirellulaceae bacterium]|nr:Uma2 family endonuclease [Lacipirellulaceae bacterium]
MATSNERVLLGMLGNPPVIVAPPRRPPVELDNGDCMSREEFHRIYESAPEDFEAELIGGTVYVASPLKLGHGEPHLLLGMVLAMYARRTPGVRASDNTTVVLGDKSEPQPDLLVRILPECGGQSSTSEGYVKGAPELIIEIAHSSTAVDLHGKKDDYTEHGVREYLVICVSENRLRWFDLVAERELQPNSAGIYRIEVFPGLWINGPALLAFDYDALIDTLEHGLATPEHAAFVEELAKRRAKS